MTSCEKHSQLVIFRCVCVCVCVCCSWKLCGSLE